MSNSVQVRDPIGEIINPSFRRRFFESLFTDTIHFPLANIILEALLENSSGFDYGDSFLLRIGKGKEAGAGGLQNTGLTPLPPFTVIAWRVTTALPFRAPIRFYGHSYDLMSNDFSPSKFP